MKRSSLIPCLLLALAVVLPASAQTSRVTVTVKGVHSSQGNVLANLCDNPNGQFPGRCMSYPAMANAEKGETTLAIDGVVAGRYAFQAFHDEDGNFTPSIPREGTAFSNDPAWPVTFETSAFEVAGDTSIVVTMNYLPSGPRAAVQPAERGAPERLEKSVKE